MKDTAIVILNWNGKKFLADFLPIVIFHSSNDADVIVADNASTDGSVEWLREHHPQIQIIQNESNGGFAKGYNDALKQLKHKYFVLLNSDIEVTEHWLKPLIDLMDTDASLFAVQPKLLSYYERSHFEYAGASGGFIDSLGFPFCRGRIFESLEEDKGQYDDAMEVFWATGACMVVRSADFLRLGGFDEEFFAHMEEIDLCWRAHNDGLKVMCEPKSVIYHIGGGTLPKRSAQKTYLNFRNNLLLLYKNLPLRRFLAILLPKLILDGVAALKFFMEGGFQDFRAVLRAHVYFYRRIATKQKSRIRIPLSRMKGVYKGSIVFAHYVGKVKAFEGLDATKFKRRVN